MQNATAISYKSTRNVFSVMARRKKDNSTQFNRYWTKPIKLNAPIGFEELMVKELPSSLEDCDICKLSVLTDPTNEDSTRIKQKICILDHLKNLIDFLRARLAISNGLTEDNITKEPTSTVLP